MSRGIFITGTDTEVGKTWVGTQLAARLYQRGIDLVARKPAESGCIIEGGELIPADARQYFYALEQTQSLESICPYRFKAPLAPVQAARLEHIRITINDLATACQSQDNRYLLVEGAGGFYSPITEDGLNADLAKALQLPVLLVAADKLGCLNHILLSQQAIEAAGLELSAIVLNQIQQGADNLLNSADMLREQLSLPLFETRKDDWLDQLTAHLAPKKAAP